MFGWEVILGGEFKKRQTSSVRSCLHKAMRWVSNTLILNLFLCKTSELVVIYEVSFVPIVSFFLFLLLSSIRTKETS